MTIQPEHKQFCSWLKNLNWSIVKSSLLKSRQNHSKLYLLNLAPCSLKESKARHFSFSVNSFYFHFLREFFWLCLYYSSLCYLQPIYLTCQIQFEYYLIRNPWRTIVKILFKNYFWGFLIVVTTTWYLTFLLCHVSGVTSSYALLVTTFTYL